MVFINWDCHNLGKMERSDKGKKWVQNTGINFFVYLFLHKWWILIETGLEYSVWVKGSSIFIFNRWRSAKSADLISGFLHKSSILTKILLRNLCWCLLIIIGVSNDDSKSALKTEIRWLYAEIFSDLRDNPQKVENSKMLQNLINDSNLTFFNIFRPPHLPKVVAVSVWKASKQKSFISSGRINLNF